MAEMNYIDKVARDIAIEADGGLAWSTADIQDRWMYRNYAVLARAKGSETTCSDVHDAWSAAMSSEMFGGRTHPSLIPYDELPTETQAKDHEYMLAIHTVAFKFPKYPDPDENATAVDKGESGHVPTPPTTREMLDDADRLYANLVGRVSSMPAAMSRVSIDRIHEDLANLGTKLDDIRSNLGLDDE